MKRLTTALLISSIVLLPGCAPLDWIKDKLGVVKKDISDLASKAKTDSSQVLATMNGKVLLTAQEFEQEFNAFMSQHPLGQVLKQMEGIEKQIFNGVLSKRLLAAWVSENKIDQTPEYQDQLDQLKVMLNAKHFEMKHAPKEVTDAEAQDYYNKNRDAIPEAVITRGGVNTIAAEFDKDADAKAFLAKVQGKGAEFAQIAKDAKIDSSKVRDFKTVSTQTVGIDSALRDAILKLQKFPAYQVIPAAGKFWVVYASGKEQAKYRPFDQVKAVVKERLGMEAARKAFETGIEDLKKEKNVKDNFDTWYAAQKKQASNAPVEGLEAVMPAADKVA